MMKFIVFISILLVTVNAFYSVHYFANEESQPVIMGETGRAFHQAPSAEHVADICARVSGHAPIMSESRENLPVADIFSQKSEKPVILEVRGGRLPVDVKPLFIASAFDNNARGPNVEDVKSVLAKHGVDCETHKMEGVEEGSTLKMAQWLGQQKRPVIILHHETPTAQHYIQRQLSQSTVTPLTEFQISQYQICLWTGVGMVLLILSAICSIVKMEVIPDSLLYAKFQSARTHKSD